MEKKIDSLISIISHGIPMLQNQTNIDPDDFPLTNAIKMRLVTELELMAEKIPNKKRKRDVKNFCEIGKRACLGNELPPELNPNYYSDNDDDDNMSSSESSEYYPPEIVHKNAQISTSLLDENITCFTQVAKDYNEKDLRSWPEIVLITLLINGYKLADIASYMSRVFPCITFPADETRDEFVKKFQENIKGFIDTPIHASWIEWFYDSFETFSLFAMYGQLDIKHLDKKHRHIFPGNTWHQFNGIIKRNDHLFSMMLFMRMIMRKVTQLADQKLPNPADIKGIKFNHFHGIETYRLFYTTSIQHEKKGINAKINFPQELLPLHFRAQDQLQLKKAYTNFFDLGVQNLWI